MRLPLLRAAAEAAGRPVPEVTARVRVTFGPATDTFYQLAGTPEQMADEVRAFAEQSVAMLAVDFTQTDPDRSRALIERFDREVIPLVRDVVPLAREAVAARDPSG